MALEGNLQLLQLPEILRSISGGHKTGILTVQGEQDIIAISFLHGSVVAADALNQTVEEGLGHVLTEQGLVTRDRLSQLAAEQQAGGGRLVDLLVQRGVVDRAQLLQALRVQTYQQLLHVLRWREGEFKFYGGDEVSYEEGFQPISIEELLVRSAADLGEELVGAAPESADVFERVPGEGEAAEGQATPEELALLQLLDGRKSLAVLSAQSGLGDYKTRYLAQRLRNAGLARPVVAPAAHPVRPREGSAVLHVEEPPAAPAPPRDLSDWNPLLARGLAAVLVLASVLSWALVPSRGPLLPFPWQQQQRAELQAQRRAVQFLRVDRACRTFYLLEGRYPDTLAELARIGLLAPADLQDPTGAALEYTPQDVSYSVRPAVAGAEPVSEGITGDFLLDPELLHTPTAQDRAPLVLLD